MTGFFPDRFDPAPCLEGERVRLRPLTPADRAALFCVASDPLIWAQHPAHDRWQPEVFDAFVDEALNEGGGLVVHDRASDEIIGFSRYATRRAEAGEVEIGWTFLARSYWGGTFNAEMKRLMLAHAFSCFEAVIFVIGAENRRSRIATGRTGAALIDQNGRSSSTRLPVAHVVYRMDRAQWGRRLATP